MLKKISLALLVVLMTANMAFAAGKTITFASDATWPPMEFLDANKKLVGFSVDLLNAMGKAGGFTPDIKNTAWDGIFAGLAAGKYQVVSSSVSITDERKATMDFSDPYYEVQQAIVTKKDAKIASAADLVGKSVGAQIGTTGFFAVKDLKGVTAKTFDEVGLAIEALASGRIDAVSCDDCVAAQYALQNSEYKDKLKIAFVLKSDKPEYYGFAVKKGTNKEALDLINKGLAAVKKSGEYDKIKAKWIGGKK